MSKEVMTKRRRLLWIDIAVKVVGLIIDRLSTCYDVQRDNCGGISDDKHSQNET